MAEDDAPALKYVSGFVVLLEDKLKLFHMVEDDALSTTFSNFFMPRFYGQKMIVVEGQV